MKRVPQLSSKHRRAHRRGVRAEWMAALWLMCHGYRLRAWRYRTPVGEIDLIMTRGRVLALIEVKARPSRAEAAEAIHPRNQQRIARAAELFLQQRPQFRDFDTRFDAVFITPRALPLHHPYAFATKG